METKTKAMFTDIKIKGERRKREIKAPKFDLFLNPLKRDAQMDLERKLTKKFR